jgi:endo-1,4-beta-xylanase
MKRLIFRVFFVVFNVYLTACINPAGNSDGGKETKVDSLKEKYNNYFLIGNIAHKRDYATNRMNLLTKEFNVITPETVLKASIIQPTQGYFDWQTADQLVNTFLSKGMKVHGHTLVWHKTTPDWMVSEGMTPADAQENMETHISTVAEHYRGKVISWDVVNEAFDNASTITNPEDWKAMLRQSAFVSVLGPGYIEKAYQIAREADPDAKLYYNDYSLNYPGKARAVALMIDEINRNNPGPGGRLLIEGIGLQSHYDLTVKPADVEASIKMFIGLGLEIAVSEMDISGSDNSTLTPENAAKQAQVYADLFKVYKKYAGNIKRVTFWGMDDGTSWHPEGCRNLFDKFLMPKPAYFALMNLNS